MARYKRYRKSNSGPTLRKPWADQLQKLNYEALNYKLNVVESLMEDLYEFQKRIDSKYLEIQELHLQLVKIRVKYTEDVEASKFLFRYTSHADEKEIEQKVVNNKKVKSLIKIAEKVDKQAMQVMNERDNLVKGVFGIVFEHANLNLTEQKPIEFSTTVHSYASNYIGNIADISTQGEYSTKTECGIDTKYYYFKYDKQYYLLPILTYLKTALNSYRSTAKKNETAKQVKKKKQERSATLAAYEDKSRNVGKSIMAKMKSDVSSPFYCPYCFKKTPKTKIHVDHINPVSNGGLSVERNLVPVCSDCNLSKSDLSLRAFCKKNSYDFEVVCNTLDSMGKFI